MKMRLCISILFGLLALIFQGTFAGVRHLTDMTGRKVSVPDKIEKVYTDRFASLIVFALDPDLLCNYTFRVREGAKKYISPAYNQGKVFSEGQDEEILGMKPDVIILGNMPGANKKEEADEMQARLEIPVLVIGFSLPEYKEMYRFLGDVLAREESARKLIAYLKRYIDPLGTKTAAIAVGKRPRIYYAEGMKGENTEPSGSFHSQVPDFVHARNVAETGAAGVHGMARVSMEQVLTWNPEVILVWTGMPSGMGLGHAGTSQDTFIHIMKDPVWAKIKAVKDKKVYRIPALPFGWFDRPPASNVVPGVLWTAWKLYPGLLTQKEMLRAVREYFVLFYHVDVTDGDILNIME